MRRTYVIAGAVAVAALAGLLVFFGSGIAQQDKNQPATSKPAAALPVGQVILYSSGVGYFQREGTVEGNTRVDLSFPIQDINDLLKSMVLRDLNGGHISAVSYDSHDPVDRTLKSFAVNFSANPSFGGILSQARGEKVETVLQQSNTTQPGTITGVIMGVEKQRQQVGKDAVVEVEMLNLWCAEGIRSVKLLDVQRVRFLNPTMESEVKKALETLALSHDTQKKAVSLSFAGEGKREVRVGYVIENPIWKTSYRLVLGKKEDKPYLQGWAIVENPSDEDWNGVRMALVSGRPISFKMDLYQPLYVARPVVEPELFASLRPPTYEGSFPADRNKALAEAMPPPPGAPPAPTGGFGAPGLELPKAKEALGAQGRRGAWDGAEKKIDLQQGIQNAATASQLGDFFQYGIDNPVSLARQKSAMLPIVNKDIDASRVSIYNQSVQAKHPLLGLRFKNTSGLHLMQGPITVFEGSSYAGDARILDLPPNDERLLSYAIDLATEVDPVVDNPKHTLTKVKVVKGILYSTTRLVEQKTFKIANRSDQDRLVLVEHPFRGDFTITSKDKPKETTRDLNRFEVKVAAGKSGSLTVAEEKDLGSTLILTNADDNSVRQFINTNVTSEKAKTALNTAIEKKGRWDTVKQDIGFVDQQLKDLERDQVRIRANLKDTPPNSEAYKKYVAKLDTQEGEIDTLTAKMKSLRAEELRLRKDYEGYLINLDIE